MNCTLLTTVYWYRLAAISKTVKHHTSLSYCKLYSNIHILYITFNATKS